MIKNKLLYICLLIILAVFYILYIDNLSFFLLMLGILFPVILFFITLHIRSKLNAELSCIKLSENKNSDITIDVNIENKSIFPVSNACVTLEIMNVLDSIPEEMTAIIPIQPKNMQNMSFNVSSKYCGKLIVSLKKIKIYDYFNINSFTKKFECHKEIVIMPQTYPIQIFTDHSLDENTESELYSKIRAGDDCSEVFNIRNYADGDKINRIHWKLSMKHDEIMVKDYSLPINCSVLLLFEFFTDYTAGYMEKLNTIIETLSSVAESIAESEAVHEIGWYNTSKNLYISNRISTSEDVASFLGTVMRATAYNEKEKAFSHHMKINAERRFSHVIYIASDISEDVMNKFDSDENTNRKTILYITHDAENLPDYFAKFYGRINIIPIQCEKLNQCLYEMLI